MTNRPGPATPSAQPPARRVLVIGNGGAGKSTLSAALGACTGLPVVHLDRHHWQPGWTSASRDEWLETLERLAAPDAWIMDGNYRGTMTMRLARADAVVLLDVPTPVCLWRIVRRRFRGRATADLAAGCEERLHLGFARYVARYRRTHLPGALAACDAAERAGKRVVRLRGRIDAESVALALGHGASSVSIPAFAS